MTCYSDTAVDLYPVARIFPHTNVDSATMVHLWPKVASSPSW